jgi:hypothetical protein
LNEHLTIKIDSRGFVVHHGSSLSVSPTNVA